MRSWVIGAGGLLGSAVSFELARRMLPQFSAGAVPWGTSQANGTLRRLLAEFIASGHDENWTIYWCAGAGVTDTDRQSLTREEEVVSGFVAALAKLPSHVLSRGTIAFASSAGGTYGGALGAPYTEKTRPVTLGAYGAAKLRTEDQLKRLANTSGIRVFIARIANLYGAGQNLNKPQGLISRLCFSALTRTPISIYVSLDTKRDYLHVRDGAHLMVDCAARLRTHDEATQLKILASGQSTSIATIIGHLRRMSGVNPLIVLGTSAASSLQNPDLRLRSTTWTDLDSGQHVTMPEGIASTMEDMRVHSLQPGYLALASSRGSSNWHSQNR